jgi:hypothetical protein
MRAWVLQKANPTLPVGRNTEVGPASASWISRETIITLVLLSLWLALIVFTTSRHEFWRDEVRALTLARAAGSPLDLYRVLGDEGHPVLWYLLLFLGTSIVDTRLVLPITSVIIGFSAVVVFVRFAPFPLWFRGLFIFSALPLFEYSVMARNYGISMLLFFVAATLYRTRATHPYRLAFVLALLANTNIHSAVMTCLVAAAWVWDLAAAQKKGLVPSEYSRYLPIAVVGAGVLLCAVIVMPRENDLVSPVRHPDGIVSIQTALRGAVLRPDLTFHELIPSWWRPKPAILLLYGAIFGLLLRPNLFLAALAAQTVLGMFFRAVYPGEYRHQGLYLVFLVFLYWLFIESVGTRAASTGRWLFRGGLFGSVLALVLVQLSRAPAMVWGDITGTRSASAAFGEYLRESPQFRDAVIVPEPDAPMESLPYYAGNQIYLPREGRFGASVSWTSASKDRLTLGDLLHAARHVRQQSGKPVLIVLAPLIDLDRAGGEQKYRYGKLFSWTGAEVEEFRRATALLQEFDATVGSEDYRVFVLKD